MYLILCDSAGRRFESILLAAGERRMRIALRGGADAIEVTRSQNQWISDEIGPVEVESIVAGEQPLVMLESPASYPLAG